MSAKSDGMKPLDVEHLDAGIRGVVTFLREHGFNTVDSGDGRSKAGGPLEGCMQECPNVTMAPLESDRADLIGWAGRLRDLIEAEGVVLGPTKETVWELAGPQGDEVEYGDGVLLESFFLAHSGHVGLYLTGLDDDLLKKCRARLGLESEG